MLNIVYIAEEMRVYRIITAFDAETKTAVTIRIDKIVLAQLQQLAPEKKDWEALIQTALQEWLERQQQKKTVREEARDMLQEALSSAQMQIVIKLPERTGELAAAH